jgi:putative phage-type endonuclease
MQLINLEQGSQEWKKFRRTHIGASDAVSIMGVSPWRSILKLYEEKIFEFDQPDNPYMARGRDLEPIALESFERDTGLVMFPQVCKHDVIDWMISSLDGMTVEKDCVVEIKCAGKKDHDIAINGKIPPKYYPQLQHQIEVTGLDFTYYYSFDGQNGVLIKVNRNPMYISNLIEKELEFWNCLKSLTPPLKRERKNG